MKEWIVVVDDEVISLTNARNLLSAQDMRVSCLRSGQDFLSFIEKNEPDLVLLDVMMPEMDGFEIYRRLREYEEKVGRRTIPVIFLTGENDNEVEREGLKIGASDFIRKPFDCDILLRRIRNTIANTKTIENLTEEATLDRLTGFLNKAHGTAVVTEMCGHETGVMAILDLDRFKLVNDIYGHDMGDQVLRSFADIIRRCTRDGDVVSRIGGDEFLAFFPKLEEDDALQALTERLNERLVEACVRLMGEDFDIPIGISVGAVMVPVEGREYQTLFRFADQALYFVKQNGKHGCFIYRKTPDGEMDGEDDLSNALAHITRIVEERGDGSGALLLGSEAFSVLYRFNKRFLKRYGGNALKLLFNLSVQHVEEVDEQYRKDAMAQFAEVLQKTLRKSDIILQNRQNQFFLLLPELTEENATIVIERIMAKWERTEYHADIRVSYDMESLLEE
ncbi:MAG: diguanylate cyclase [Lachnospiraceae bacterium]|nr:diguanylate cyclase [Lachnospiraceae bacterium]